MHVGEWKKRKEEIKCRMVILKVEEWFVLMHVHFLCIFCVMCTLSHSGTYPKLFLNSESAIPLYCLTVPFEIAPNLLILNDMSTISPLCCWEEAEGSVVHPLLSKAHCIYCSVDIKFCLSYCSVDIKFRLSLFRFSKFGSNMPQHPTSDIKSLLSNHLFLCSRSIQYELTKYTTAYTLSTDKGPREVS